MDRAERAPRVTVKTFIVRPSRHRWNTYHQQVEVDFAGGRFVNAYSIWDGGARVVIADEREQRAARQWASYILRSRAELGTHDVGECSSCGRGSVYKTRFGFYANLDEVDLQDDGETSVGDALDSVFRGESASVPEIEIATLIAGGYLNEDRTLTEAGRRRAERESKSRGIVDIDPLTRWPTLRIKATQKVWIR